MEFNEIIQKLQEEREYARLNYVPIIRDKSAEILYNYIKDNNYKKILEIGTAIGYSGSIIMSVGDINLTTIDINADYLNMANSTFKKMGFIDRVSIYHDDAWNVINDFKSRNIKFDMIFLDGAKGQYIRYLDVLTSLLNNGGAIFADNVLLHGMVESKDEIPHKKRTMVMNLRKYLDKVNSDQYETKILRIEDGIAITKLKEKK